MIVGDSVVLGKPLTSKPVLLGCAILCRFCIWFIAPNALSVGNTCSGFAIFDIVPLGFIWPIVGYGPSPCSNVLAPTTRRCASAPCAAVSAGKFSIAACVEASFKLANGDIADRPALAANALLIAFSRSASAVV